MKRIMQCLLAVVLSIGGTALASGPCTPGPNWTQSWTDAFNQTTYTISAPPCVYVNVPFNIVVRATDSTWPDNTVGSSWKVLDNGAVVDSGTVIRTSGGVWEMVIPVTYTVLVINHSIQFEFRDFADEADTAHFWPVSQTPIGGTTVDPYPPAPNTAPTVDAGPDQVLLSADLPNATLPAATVDVDGDVLTYRWLDGEVEIQPAWPVGADGSAPLYLDGILPLALGAHHFTVEVTDGTAVTRDEVALTVLNTPPLLVAGGGTFPVNEGARLTGTVGDFDGDAISYRWTYGRYTMAQGSVATPVGGAPVALPAHSLRLAPGAYVFTLSVTDGIEAVESTAVVTVTPPRQRRPAPPYRPFRIPW